MDVLFIAVGDETVGSTRLRILNLVPLLERDGLDCKIVSTIDPPGTTLRSKIRYVLGQLYFYIAILIEAFRSDVIVIHRKTLPSPYLRVLSAVTQRLIYDIDDAIYTSPHWIEDTDKKREQAVQKMFRGSDFVTTGSPQLRDYATNHASEAYFLPTPFPRAEYADQRRERSERTESDDVVLGWIGYPENLRYLATIESTLERLLDSYDHLRLNIITAGERPVEPLADRPDVTYLEWSLEREKDLLSRSDIGIRPLIDEPWTNGKAHGSVIQYKALGLPVVVTPVGFLSELVDDGLSGFHATSADEWFTAISSLVENPDERHQKGKQAVKSLEKNRFWTDQVAVELCEIIRGADSRELEKKFPRFDDR